MGVVFATVNEQWNDIELAQQGFEKLLNQHGIGMKVEIGEK